jgi:hypothetical protein
MSFRKVLRVQSQRGLNIRVDENLGHNLRVFAGSQCDGRECVSESMQLDARDSCTLNVCSELPGDEVEFQPYAELVRKDVTGVFPVASEQLLVVCLAACARSRASTPLGPSSIVRRDVCVLGASV